jgi:photosystem II stability/assembly factor-like uncharacterized protein
MLGCTGQALNAQTHEGDASESDSSTPNQGDGEAEGDGVSPTGDGGPDGDGQGDGDAPNPRVDAGPNPCATSECPAGQWQNITPPGLNPATYPCTDLQFDPGNPSTLIAYYGDGGGIWKSTNAGSSWTQIGNLPMPNSLGRLLIDPENSERMYATGSVRGNSLGFWISNDGGDTWSIPPAFQAGVGSMWNADVYNMVADPTDFDHFLLTFHSGWPCCGNSAGVLESKDGGNSFIVHPPAPGMDHGQGIAFLYDPALGIGNANTWLMGAGYGAGLFRTSNAGESWTMVSGLQENHGGFDAHYSAQGFLYIGANGGVYRSTDNGQSWQMAMSGLPNSYFYSVISDGHFLYTGQAFVGVQYNTPTYVALEGGDDEGMSWSAYSDQIIPEGPFKMVFDAENGVIYSAAWGSGAWALKVAEPTSN